MKQHKPISAEQARLKMAGLCASSEHCEYEIREKLRKMKLSPTDIQDITEFLISNKFIDNARFARSFANDKLRFSLWGKNKIRMGLALKRIPREDINTALDNIDDEEYRQVLMKAAAAKAKNSDLADYSDRTALYRHLLSRGFESALVASAIKELAKTMR